MIDELVLSLKQIMDAGGNKPEDQIKTLKIMFVEFAATGRDKNLPLMQDVVVDFIRKQYPHLKEDLDKLLMLA
jgi:hypothetical protein